MYICKALVSGLTVTVPPRDDFLTVGPGSDLPGPGGQHLPVVKLGASWAKEEGEEGADQQDAGGEVEDCHLHQLV